MTNPEQPKKPKEFFIVFMATFYFIVGYIILKQMGIL